MAVRHEHSHAPGLAATRDRGLVVAGRREDRRQDSSISVQGCETAGAQRSWRACAFRQHRQAPRDNATESSSATAAADKKPGRNEEDWQDTAAREFQIRARQPPRQGADAATARAPGRAPIDGSSRYLPDEAVPGGDGPINTGFEARSSPNARGSPWMWRSTARVEEA